MNNKKIQYINLLLPTILYFLPVYARSHYGTWNHESIIFQFIFIVFIILFSSIFCSTCELLYINFVLAKDNAKVRILGTMAFCSILYIFYI